MAGRSKRWLVGRESVDPTRKYSLEEGVKLLKGTCTAKFDESVDVAVRLGVDPRHADQMIRGACNLPHGTGKSVRVLVFAQGDAAKSAEAAGADFVGGDELIQKVGDGWMDFDKVVATRDMMGKVGKIGRVLGPRGLMPNPKTGTVVESAQVAQAVKDLKGGKIDFRVEKAGIIHTIIGKGSMTETQLAENLTALINELMRLKPSTAKGNYLRGVAVAGTMGVGVRLDPNDLVRASGQ